MQQWHQLRNRIAHRHDLTVGDADKLVPIQQAESIIGNLDEDGYLSASLEEIATAGEHKPEHVQEALCGTELLSCTHLTVSPRVPGPDGFEPGMPQPPGGVPPC